ncbi:bacterial transcriptional activator domain-containing protein [Paucibacter sp. R3-3]|uniref:Bacterial transcriptional activator domain-containing protein n=1 Tax=Roseateles agri TaxID=3098619 RepID=A0ABU5D9F8_9BURK|nr:bacterial transcriptional activator domain-containing protein [Paucibacter sp. R3-3]MDY0742915.1 bacterial transcriptional activator domain-containing protein [Paucibacter sp. R3-3]
MAGKLGSSFDQAEAAQTSLRSALDRSHRGEWRAWAEFAELHDQACREGDQILSWQATAGLMLTGQHFRRFERFEEGLAELEPVRVDAAGLDATQELLVLNAFLLALMLCRPLDPSIDACAARLQLLIEQQLDVNLTLAAGRTLTFYFEPRNLREPALRVHALIGPRMAEPEATPYRKARWLHMWRICAHYGRQPHLAMEALEQMSALARQHSMRDVEYLAVLIEAQNALPHGDIPTARAAIERAEALVDSTQLGELVLLELEKTRLAFMRREVASALHHASRARWLSDEVRMPAAMRWPYAVNEAFAQLLGEDYEGGRASLQALAGSTPAGYAQEVDAMLQGIDAYLAVCDGLPDANRRIEALWAGLRRRRSYDFFDHLPEFCARLCVLALDRGIETDFVRSFISKCELAAPDSAPPSWPWPLRIQAFGGFAVWRNDELLAAEGKAQRKPLALLQALVALGAFNEGSAVDVAHLVELLWPDLDAASPKASFEMTLSRLRKWLGVEQALRLSNGRLSLNSRLVWCDADAFERTCVALQQTLRPHADAAALPTLLQQMNELYRGRLFGNAVLEPWLVQARERHVLRFTRLVRDAGKHLETMQNWSEALSLYEASLEQDLMAESLHLALIRCLLALGREGEARRALQRCEDVLGIDLNSASGTELRELATRLSPLR